MRLVVSKLMIAQLCLCATLVAGASAPARAQSLFDFLFGGTSTTVTQPRFSPYVFDHGDRDRFSPRPVETFDGGTRYRTVCVRLCDGFYFPISFSTPRHRIYRDADICQARCGTAARLYFHSNRTGSIETARDQRGLAYKDLRNAFLYRKKRIASCRCRPDPWAASEMARHRRYADLEREQKHRITASSDDRNTSQSATGISAIEIDGTENQIVPVDRPEVDRPEPVTFTTSSEHGHMNDARVYPRPVKASARRRNGQTRRTTRQKPEIAPKGFFEFLTAKPKFSWPGGLH